MECKYSSLSSRSKFVSSSKYSAASLSLSDFWIKQAKNIPNDKIFKKSHVYKKFYVGKTFTLIGWIRRIDEKKPLINDVNHFWVFKSPNSIPRAIIKMIDTTANINDKPYARKIHHQGKVSEGRFFWLDSTYCLLNKRNPTVSIFILLYLRDWLLFYLKQSLNQWRNLLMRLSRTNT